MRQNRGGIDRFLLWHVRAGVTFSLGRDGKKRPHQPDAADAKPEYLDHETRRIERMIEREQDKQGAKAIKAWIERSAHIHAADLRQKNRCRRLG